MLQTRLTELREAGFVELAEDGYGLTALGRELLQTFAPLQSLCRAVEQAGRKPDLRQPPVRVIAAERCGRAFGSRYAHPGSDYWRKRGDD